MKVIYDPDQDILQIALVSAVIEETTQISPGLVLDYDEDGQVIGLEIRKVSSGDSFEQITDVHSETRIDSYNKKALTFFYPSFQWIKASIL